MGAVIRWCQRCRQSLPVGHEHPPTLFDTLAAEVDADVERLMEGPGQARHSDPDTSKLAAQMMKARATSARVLLLGAFYAQRESDGLTDEEAAALADVSLTSEYATRCSELRRGGLIEPTGATREGHAGARREVSRITQLGSLIMAKRLDMGA